MKKSFFLSILAVGAVLAGCSKSEIVDSKYGNDQIGFENYLGRDAQTKAAVATSVGTAGMYGFYTAGTPWSSDAKANLWVNDPLDGSTGTVTPPKFWTNENDLYTFLAYAPKDAAGVVVPTGENVANPTVTYTVNGTLANQIDLLYAVAKDQKKQDSVPFQFKHALSRLTVKASTAANQQFEFRVKEITISGGFITSDVLTLETGAWAANSTPVAVTETTPATTYTFYNDLDNATALSTTATDYSSRTVTEGETTSTVADNYLMMIPVNFANAAATVTVKYTTFYEGTESTVNTATVPVTTNFEKGKAYSINLEFSKTTQEIKFTVSVENWDEGTTAEDGTNPNVQNGSIAA